MHKTRKAPVKQMLVFNLRLAKLTLNVPSSLDNSLCSHFTFFSPSVSTKRTNTSLLIITMRVRKRNKRDRVRWCGMEIKKGTDADARWHNEPERWGGAKKTEGRFRPCQSTDNTTVFNWIRKSATFESERSPLEGKPLKVRRKKHACKYFTSVAGKIHLSVACHGWNDEDEKKSRLSRYSYRANLLYIISPAINIPFFHFPRRGKEEEKKKSCWFCHVWACLLALSLTRRVIGPHESCFVCTLFQARAPNLKPIQQKKKTVLLELFFSHSFI